MAQKPYAAMQVLIRDQQATAQAMREAATSIKNAADMMAITMGNNVSEVGPSGDSGFRSGPGLGGVPRHGSGPHDNRPRMRDNQTYRPVHSVEHTSHGHGLTGIRNRIADQLHTGIGHRSGSTFESIHDDQGNHVGYRETKADGTVATRELDDPNLAQDLASAGRRATVSRVVGAFGSNGMLAGARAIPYVGTALMAGEAVHAGLAMYGNQRQENAQYQAIYGGSNLSTGFRQRMDEEGFRLGQFFSGGLTGSQATQAFRGVSQLGYQGSQRSEDLNFISSNYKSVGMGVADSLKLISTASKNLNADLSGLKDSLKLVSDAAKQTGQNAVNARALFSSNYSAISNIAPGSAAAPIAGALTSMQTSMGRSMQGLDFSGALTSLGGQAQLAAIGGQTISQFRSNELTNPSGALGSLDTLMAQIVAPFLTDDVKNAINQAVSQVSGGMTTIQANPDMVGQVITPQILKIVNADAIAAAFGRIPGLNVDPVRAVTLMIQQYLGLAGNTQGQYQKMLQSKQQNLSLAKNATNGSPTRSGVYANAQHGGALNTPGVNPVVDDAKSTLKGQNIIVNSAGGQRVVSMDVAARDYTDQVAKGTAVVADTGQTIQQTLNESETNYQGTDTSSYKASKGQTDKKSGLNSDRGMSVQAYQAMKTKGDKGSGVVTISPSKELAQLLNFQTSGNVQLATGGAALGVPPQPGN